MKKKLFILFSLLLLLSGCNNDTEDITTDLNSSEDIGQANKSEAPDMTERISNTKPDNEVPAPPSTFEITSKSIAQIIYSADVDGFSQNIGNYNVDVFPYEDYLLYCVTMDGEEFPSLIYAYDQSKPGTSESADMLIQSFLDNSQYNTEIQRKSYNLDDSSRCIISCAWVKNSGATKFPLTIQIVPETDYFLYTDTAEYKTACIEGRYNDILADVESYINTTSPPSYDNAYTLISVLTPIVDQWDKIEVEYDSIEKCATFFYSGINIIDNNTHFVPYATTNERKIHSLIGFYDSDWLFFDNIIISSTENVRISTSRNKIEEVTKSGKIYEAYDTSFDDDVLEELLTSPSHTIRFNAPNTYKDYEMSSEEYEALSVISNFQDVRNILSDLLFRFQKRQK